MADDFPTSTSTAGILVLGEYSIGRLDGIGDQDWFRITLDAGTTYRIDVEGQGKVSRGFWDPHLGGVYDASGTFLPGTTNYSGGERQDARLYFTPTSSGTYFVSAGAAENLSPIANSQYRVRVTDNWDDYASGLSTAGELTRPVWASTSPFSATGRSDWQGDRDWFAIDLEAGKSYTAIVNGAGVRTGNSWTFGDGHIFGVHDPSGTYLPGTSDADSGAGTGALVDFTATVSGTHYISAGLSPTDGSKGTYQVVLYEDDYSQDMGTTGRLAVGGSVAGRSSRPGDRDWFAIDLEAGETYTFAMEGDYSLWPRIHSIRDASGQRFAESSAIASSYSDLAITSFTAPADGTYFVDVEAHASWRFPSSYRLTAFSNDLADDSGTEGRIAVNGSLRSSIDFSGDSDWIAVDFNAGETYRVTMSGAATGGGSLVDPLIHSIRDSNGVHIPGSSNRNANAGDPEVWFTATQTATHYIDARAVQQSGSTYTMRVARVEDDFGSDPDSAGALSLDGRVTGSVDTPTDTDWFAVELTAGETYRVRIMGSASGDGTLPRPLLAGLFEPDGDKVPGSVKAGSAAGLNTDLIHTATETGTFHISVGGHLNHRGTYALELVRMETITGTAGDDWLVMPEGVELLTARGGTGRDMLSFVFLPDGAKQGVSVDLAADTAFLHAFDRTIDLHSIEDVTGSSHRDTFNGSDRAEIFRGLGGDDLFFGSDGGADVYDGGAGLDTLSYALSDAGVHVSLLRGKGWVGDARQDVIRGIENLIGTAHDDFLWGDHGANRLDGGAGNDTIVGNDGDDLIFAGTGTDVIIFSGNQADYTILRNGIRTEVTDNVGNDGHDIVESAEILRFADNDMIL